MTGMAIVLYLNQTPSQPRERDYAYAGSFYAYAIWCGMGVTAIAMMLQRFIKKYQYVVSAIVSAACLLVPIQMASQNWDDHDRSGRYTCRDFGQNYLMSLQDEGKPIIFTNGDNDTFPLWYNQDTEGVRTDARVCNLSYLNTDWYIDQMIRPAYDSPSLPINWSRLEYCSGTNEYVKVDRHIRSAIELLRKQYPAEVKELFGEDPYELKNVLKYWVRDHRSDELKQRQKAAIELAYNQIEEIKNDYYYELESDLHVIPTDTVYLTIDKEAVRKSGMKIQGDSIPDRMVISLKGLGGLDKSKLMMLELLANANWTRPIYVAYTVGQENYMNLGDNFVQEGLANRITPFTTNINGKVVDGMKNFDTEKTYDNVMNRFKFGNVKQQDIYLDETVMRMCFTHRRLLAQLALNLAQEDKSEKAAKVLALCEQELPCTNVPHSYESGSLDMARTYVTIGNKAKAQEILDQMWKKSIQYLGFYMSLSPSRFSISNRDCMLHLYIMEHLIHLAGQIDQKKAEAYTNKFEEVLTTYQSKGGDLGF